MSTSRVAASSWIWGATVSLCAIGFSVSDLLEFINEAERKETKMENSKRKTHWTKVTSDHCQIFVGDFCWIVYLFVWYNFLCILGCFCCRWKSCFTQCVVFFCWWQPSQSKGQQATSLLVSSHHQGPAVQMSSTKKLPCFLSQTKKKRVCRITHSRKLQLLPHPQ